MKQNCKPLLKCRLPAGRNQPKTCQNRRIFRELNNVTLAEPPSKLIGQTLVLIDLFIESSITTHQGRSQTFSFGGATGGASFATRGAVNGLCRTFRKRPTPVAWRHAENFRGATGGSRQNLGGHWPPWHPHSSAPATHQCLLAASDGLLQFQLALVTNKFYPWRVGRGEASPVATEGLWSNPPKTMLQAPPKFKYEAL